MAQALITTIITLCSLLALSPSLHAEPLILPLYEKGSSVFYMQASVDGIGSTEFMLDTGSAYLALNSNIMAQLKQQGKARFIRYQKAKLASGQIDRVKIYRVSRLRLSESCVLDNIEAVMLPKKTRNILGINVLKQTAPISISLSPPTLRLDGCRSALNESLASREGDTTKNSDVL